MSNQQASAVSHGRKRSESHAPPYREVPGISLCSSQTEIPGSKKAGVYAAGEGGIRASFTLAAALIHSGPLSWRLFGDGTSPNHFCLFNSNFFSIPIGDFYMEAPCSVLHSHIWHAVAALTY